METIYKDVPYEVKRNMLDRHFKILYGHGYHVGGSSYFNRDFANAVKGLSKTIKRNIVKKHINELLVYNEYWALLRSGKFWEFFPQLTGNLGKDKEEFSHFIWGREEAKGWIDAILNPKEEE